jgi:hypothetical protein
MSTTPSVPTQCCQPLTQSVRTSLHLVNGAPKTFRERCPPNACALEHWFGDTASHRVPPALCSVWLNRCGDGNPRSSICTEPWALGLAWPGQPTQQAADDLVVSLG